MKITKWVTPEEQEIEVSVSIDDIQDLLEESPETIKHAFALLNKCAKVIKAITDDMIKDMSTEQRNLIREFLVSQAQRYSVK